MHKSECRRATLDGGRRGPAELRARIILASTSARTDVAVARELHLHRLTVGHWRRRFHEARLDGLLDEPRPGAPRRITDAMVERVITDTLESMPRDATHWSTRSMAKATGLSQSAVARIWKAFALQPHRVDTFKLSKDPLFIDKVRDIVGLYPRPAGARPGVVRRREISNPSAGSHRPRPAAAAGPSRTAHARLRAPRHHDALCGASYLRTSEGPSHAAPTTRASYPSNPRPISLITGRSGIGLAVESRRTCRCAVTRSQLEAM